ncbi:MAG: sigma-54 dependent transcriptional regulator [Pseudomonadota bacterium]
MVGGSAAFRDALDKIDRFAGCIAPVLVEGETGTGKELAARALHARSDRSSGPFVALNVAALPEALVVNELFGHEGGAYTGAAGRQGGLVAEAEGGTLFLDEIDGLPLGAQAVLLRFLQDQEYRPLGGGRMRRADVRVVAASNAGMAGLIGARQFREDLFWRLAVLQLTLPPLRERPGDLEPLVAHFLGLMRRRYGGARRGIAPGAWEAMRRHPWPGNVRELENRVHRGYVLAAGAAISAEAMDLTRTPDAAPDAGDSAACAPFAAAKADAVAAFERAYIARALAETGGNVSAASRLAGKERRAFTRLIAKHGIDWRDFVTGR